MKRRIVGTFQVQLLVASMILFGGACATANDHAVGVAPIRWPDKVGLRVTNRSWSDIRVYAVRDGGHPVRIGSIPSLTNKIVFLQATLLTDRHVRFLLRPLGSTITYTTGEVIVPRNGDVIALTVENNLQLSHLSLATR